MVLEVVWSRRFLEQLVVYLEALLEWPLPLTLYTCGGERLRGDAVEKERWYEIDIRTGGHSNIPSGQRNIIKSFHLETDCHNVGVWEEVATIENVFPR